MEELVICERKDIVNVADAIRSKTGKTESMTLFQMASNINNLELGSAQQYGQSDWNASEGEPGYIANRTHWVESNVVELIPETTLTTTEDNAGIFAIPDGVFSLEAGKTYIVNYNGTPYTCTAVDAASISPELAGMVALGNYGLELGTGDTGEPFIAVYFPGEGTNVIDLNGALSITASVSYVDETVHKLPVEYLPDGLPYSEVVKVNPTFDGDLTGREYIEVDTGVYAVKVSDQYLEVEDIIGATLAFDIQGTEQEIVLATNEVFDASLSDLGVAGSIIVPQSIDSMIAISLPEDTVVMEIALSAGTWFMYMQDEFYVKSLSCLESGEKEILHKLDNKFIDAEWMANIEKRLVCPEFDGNIEKHEYFNLYNELNFVKMSDKVLNTTQLEGSTLCVSSNGVEQYIKLTSDMINGDNSYIVVVDGSMPLLIVALQDINMDEGVIVTTGTWFLSLDTNIYVKSVSCLTEVKEVANKIPKKFLPDMLPEVSSNDNGAFLRVIDGAWAIDMLGNVEDGEF